ncbi:MAG: M15 family metallopeptidase [Candidatus Babeliales bacterium]
MRRLICAFALFSLSLNASWKEHLESKKSVINESAYRLLTAQHELHVKNDAPKIVDPRVKTIPIIESNEPLVDVNASNHARISMLPNPTHPFASADCNSGFTASSKIRRSVFVKLQGLVNQLDTLAPHFGYQAGQIHIKVFEGLRDLKTQEMLFTNKAHEIQQANPSMSEEEAFAETCKWVSPVRNNIPVHSTGAAVDIRLWDIKNNQFIDMGPFGVIWGKNTTAPTFSADLTEEQINNRLLLLAAAAQAGLVNYTYEWWHFSHGDRYASFWQEADASKRSAIYDAVKNSKL